MTANSVCNPRESIGVCIATRGTPFATRFSFLSPSSCNTSSEYDFARKPTNSTIGFACVSSLNVPNRYLFTALSVSYTHLDVYKRQRVVYVLLVDGVLEIGGSSDVGELTPFDVYSCDDTAHTVVGILRRIVVVVD